jgi:aminopeptidase N
LYTESVHGVDAAQQELIADRQQVIQFNSRNPRPIVDTAVTDYNRLLNTNSYQKASWVLHLLRQKVGDSAFWKGVRTYYDRFKFSNALTDDFRKVMEETSGKDLQSFFQQWIFGAGQPKLQVTWTYNAAAKEINLDVQQTQIGHTFQFPLDVAIYSDNTQMPQIHTFTIQKVNQNFTIKMEKMPTKVLLDPNVKMLWEGNITKK